MENKENTREQRLKYAFAAHMGVMLFFVTSDDQMFVQKCDAENHASTLENKDIDEANRKNYVTSPAIAVPDNQLDLERESLVIRHQELFDGKKPAKNAAIETIKAKIKAEEERLADEVQKAAELDGSAEDADSDKGTGSEEEE